MRAGLRRRAVGAAIFPTGSPRHPGSGSPAAPGDAGLRGPRGALVAGPGPGPAAGASSEPRGRPVVPGGLPHAPGEGAARFPSVARRAEPHRGGDTGAHREVGRGAGGCVLARGPRGLNPGWTGRAESGVGGWGWGAARRVLAGRLARRLAKRLEGGGRPDEGASPGLCRPRPAEAGHAVPAFRSPAAFEGPCGVLSVSPSRPPVAGLLPKPLRAATRPRFSHPLPHHAPNGNAGCRTCVCRTCYPSVPSQRESLCKERLL